MHDLKLPIKIMFSYFDESESIEDLREEKFKFERV